MTAAARMGQRGVAMLAAIWLVLVLSAAAMDFAVVAADRRALGEAASDRGRAFAAGLGAIQIMQSRLDQALIQTSINGSPAATRLADAWLDADSLYGGWLTMADGTEVEVWLEDVASRLNINTANDASLRSFLGRFVDATVAGTLSAAIQDWRDIDVNTRVNGAEEGEYLDAGMLALPTNAPFRDPGDLLQVYGMTQEMYDLIAPYVTTYGTGQINVNTAPEEVLWGLPNASEALIAMIVSARSVQGARISNLTQVTAVIPEGLQAAFTAGATAQSNQMILTATAYASPMAKPVRMRALLTRNGTTTTIGWKQW